MIDQMHEKPLLLLSDLQASQFIQDLGHCAPSNANAFVHAAEIDVVRSKVVIESSLF